MKFSINQDELANALSIVQKGISTRSTLPVLSGVYIETSVDSVTFQTTDLELSIRYTTPALVEEEGSAVVPGKLALDIVKSLPDASVHIDTQDYDAYLTCENSSFSIKGLNPQDFPGFPTVSADQQISVPFTTFSEMAKQVSRVVSKDESRPVLTGVLVERDGATLRMVATDSYRLAVSERDIEGGDAGGEFSAIIAGTFVSEIAALPKSGEDITLGLADNQIIITYGGTTFVNRRIEGRYPNYRQLLPKSYDTRAVVDTAQIIAATKRASLLDRAGAQVKYSISKDGTLELSSMSQDIGSTQETIAAQVEGEDMEIAFNSTYVLDGLNVLGDDSVALEVTTSLKPGIFKGANKPGYLYLVMPVRFD